MSATPAAALFGAGRGGGARGFDGPALDEGFESVLVVGFTDDEAPKMVMSATSLRVHPRKGRDATFRVLEKVTPVRDGDALPATWPDCVEDLVGFCAVYHLIIRGGFPKIFSQVTGSKDWGQ